MAAAPVVYDVNVLVNAVAGGKSDFLTWPVLPPKSTNPEADCVGVVNDDHDFTLWLSPHILDNTRRVLLEAGFQPETADAYVETLEEIAVGSGGQVVEPERTVHVNDDHEDNLILDLAAHCGAVMIVSNDSDLLDMPMWRGTPVLRPRDFASRVDAKRRAEKVTPADPSTTDRLREQSIRRSERSTVEMAMSMPEYDPQVFSDERERITESYDRLVDVVDSWNPHNESIRPKIDRWRQNLQVIDQRITNIDAIAETTPAEAQGLLVTLNQQMNTALEHLDPVSTSRSAPQTQHSGPGSEREPTEPEASDEPQPGG